jgi:hypothetical protein
MQRNVSREYVKSTWVDAKGARRKMCDLPGRYLFAILKYEWRAYKEDTPEFRDLVEEVYRREWSLNNRLYR